MSTTSPPYAMSSEQSRTAQASTVDSGGCCGHGAGCSCGACDGLQALVRPRFFAGQVLTEVDLMALESYAVTAHRLHNRYLHGPGVVCGLDLSCEDCGDGIAVCPGYALDQCGRDLIVGCVQSVDVASMIAACLAAERTTPACDPPLRGAPKGCPDDSHWCLTIRYTESQMRPVTPLGKQSCGCGGNASGKSGGCGCGGQATPTSGWSCTCGQGGSRSTGTCGCNSTVPASSLPPGCEPTRIVECFEFGVCRCDGSCCTLASVLDGTLPAKLLECLHQIKPIVGRGLSSKQQKAMAQAAFGQVTDADSTRAGVTTLYRAVLTLYQANPCRTTCKMPTDFQKIDNSPQQDGETAVAYNARLVNGTQLLVGLVVAYLRDCLCASLNPPCPSDCDDRIVLGCFSFEDGAVSDICNIECRPYAGSFTSRDYWLPIAPVALWALGALCCFPLTERVANVAALSDQIRATPMAEALQALDPTGDYRRVLTADQFAAPVGWPSQVLRLAAKLRPAALRDRLTPSARAVSLAALAGEKSEAAAATLKEAGVPVQVVEVKDATEVPFDLLGAVGVVDPGVAVRQYVADGVVVGYARASAAVEPSQGEAAPGGEDAGK
jgi:hypothetical protein